VTHRPSEALPQVIPCSGGHCKGKNAAEPPHGCPYQEEINDSTDESYCTCCDDCRRECLYDI
jgi:hypothetical protein